MKEYIPKSDLTEKLTELRKKYIDEHEKNNTLESFLKMETQLVALNDAQELLAGLETLKHKEWLACQN